MFFCLQDGKWNIEDETEELQDEDEDEEDEEDDEEEEEESDEEGEEEGGNSDEEEEDGHSDLESENGSEDEEGNPEDKDKSSKALSQEEIKAQQEAAKSELPYTFAGTCTPRSSERRPPARGIYRLWRLVFFRSSREFERAEGLAVWPHPRQPAPRPGQDPEVQPSQSGCGKQAQTAGI